MEPKVRAALAGAGCGAAAWLIVAGTVNLDSERYLVLGALPGAVLMPSAWGRWLAARRSARRHLVGLALPFLNVPLTGAFGWALGVLFGPRGGLIGRVGGLVGVVLGAVPGMVVLAWFLVPVAVVTTLIVSLAAREGTRGGDARVG